MNRLKDESSLYLLQHATNPVHWFPFGQEALDLAKEENKPILISVGYSTCHWCHVMARESFSDPATANFMNQNFINIKVDREERPDVDDMCMEVLLTITGNGGWPCNVFLTSDGRPFYGGTYFPPENRLGRHSWRQVIENISRQYNNNYDVINRQADNVVAFLKDRSNKVIDQIGRSEFLGMSYSSLAATVFEGIKSEYDPTYGGFGTGQKFPMFSTLELLAVLAKFGNSEAAEMLEFTLDKILSGGIYDQIGGGIFRYTVDRGWKIPHFEKMLYDNALFIKLLAISIKMNPTPYKINKLNQTIAFVKREMQGGDGLFYAAINADSEGEEGKFYVWNYDDDELDLFLQEQPIYLTELFDITPEGNWEGKTILNERRGVLEKYNIQRSDIENDILEFSAGLLKLRNKRVRPDTDQKNILSWNCWMVMGMLEASEALNDVDLGLEMIACFENLDNYFVETNKILRLSTNSNKKIESFSEDLSAWLQLSIRIFEFTGEDKYIEKAIELFEELEYEFLDKEQGFLRNIRNRAQGILIPKTNLFDYSTPSENAMFIESIRRLYALIGEQKYMSMYTKALQKSFQTALKLPVSMSGIVVAGLMEVYGRKEAVVLGSNALIFREIISNKFLPNIVLAIRRDNRPNLFIYKDRFKSDQTIAYICTNGVCHLPVKDVKEFVKMF